MWTVLALFALASCGGRCLVSFCRSRIVQGSSPSGPVVFHISRYQPILFLPNSIIVRLECPNNIAINSRRTDLLSIYEPFFSPLLHNQSVQSYCSNCANNQCNQQVKVHLNPRNDNLYRWHAIRFTMISTYACFKGILAWRKKSNIKRFWQRLMRWKCDLFCSFQYSYPCSFVDTPIM